MSDCTRSQCRVKMTESGHSFLTGKVTTSYFALAYMEDPTSNKAEIDKKSNKRKKETGKFTERFQKLPRSHRKNRLFSSFDDGFSGHSTLFLGTQNWISGARLLFLFFFPDIFICSPIYFTRSVRRNSTVVVEVNCQTSVE